MGQWRVSSGDNQHKRKGASERDGAGRDNGQADLCGILASNAVRRSLAWRTNCPQGIDATKAPDIMARRHDAIS